MNRIEDGKACKPDLIRIVNASKTYNQIKVKVDALKDINLSIDQSQFVAIVGESGCGKSTLLNMMTGIDSLTSGQIYIGDACIHDMSQQELSRWRGRNIGIVFQFFQLIPTLSVIDNVMLPMDFCGVHAPGKRKRVAEELLARVGIVDQANKLPSALSGGQQQRAAIARSLANDPPILVADEPTGNLDSKTSKSIANVFRQLAGEGKTLIMVTHSKDLAASAERVVTMRDGEILRQEIS